MRHWDPDEFCARQYSDPRDRRFHAQPVACPDCGPHYYLVSDTETIQGDAASIRRAAFLLKGGRVLAIKGLGGYHLACHARHAKAITALRERKYRKEKPFAVMVRSLEVARTLADLTEETEALLTSVARPIVLAPARMPFAALAPDNDQIGLMLPYAPLHYLLFAAGAPEAIVMTSANRSSEPIAYTDTDAWNRLSGIADAFLVGQRPIARRVDDSVARVGAFGPMVLRRSRGFAPGAVSTLPVNRPILALGADLKNTITLVVRGQAFVSQHIGDLDDYEALKSFRETIQDLVSMYEVDWNDLLLAHDSHPQYVSTGHSSELPSRKRRSIQHHRAHIASVLAERQAWDKRIVGVSFDGTGYGDDGTIWGGEFFVGSVAEGFKRVVHLATASLPGGDAAARHPVQCAAGFLTGMSGLPDLMAPPFSFPDRYTHAVGLLKAALRTFETTSAGRLFDTAAALLGFTREATFEGQAVMWLEDKARNSPACKPYPFPLANDRLDFRPLLESVIHDRRNGRDSNTIARAFHAGVAQGICRSVRMLCEAHALDTVVLSGGVFQNDLLLQQIKVLLASDPIQIWTNAVVPPNDGGISLGQAALAAFPTEDVSRA
jgi:hydrogenase maturation protein HypF